VKPFYYWYRGWRWRSPSEAKALLEVPGIAPELDLQSRISTDVSWVPDGNHLRGIFNFLPVTTPF